MALYEIEIESCALDEYEPVAFRVPKAGELYMDGTSDSIGPRGISTWQHGPRMIFRRKWQPAPWMPKNAVLFLNAINRWVFGKGNRDAYIDAETLACMYGETFNPPPTSPVHL